MKTLKIFAKDITGINAISMQSGQLLYKEIYKPIIQGDRVVIDFTNVEVFASPFFNASIAFILKDIDVKTLQDRLNIINISEVGRHLLNKAIGNAINKYSLEENKIGLTDEEKLNIYIKNAEDN